MVRTVVQSTPHLPRTYPLHVVLCSPYPWSHPSTTWCPISHDVLKLLLCFHLVHPTLPPGSPGNAYTEGPETSEGNSIELAGLSSWACVTLSNSSVRSIRLRSRRAWRSNVGHWWDSTRAVIRVFSPVWLFASILSQTGTLQEVTCESLQCCQ